MVCFCLSGTLRLDEAIKIREHSLVTILFLDTSDKLKTESFYRQFNLDKLMLKRTSDVEVWLGGVL